MKIAITGAGGMLGQDMVAAADAVHHEVAAFTRADLDVTDERAVLAAFERELPSLVINCAAYTDVDGAETDEVNAFMINEDGARNVAAAAAAIGARVIQISTDYVFDGTKREPYVESDPTGAIGVYGRSKLAGEKAVREANPRHLIVRTSWLYGLGGKNFVETMLGLAAERREILVVTDQIGCPTYTRELADAVIELADYERLGVMHICGASPCSWYDFAREIFRQSQVEVMVLSGTTEMLARPAPRPVYSAMISERDETPALSRWDHGLHAYLVARSVLHTQENEALDPNMEINS
ncbi:MAG: dTDP-4-dehydrorhamnose reductase [Thermoleophilaceae bacterium]|nr:dTDP-4-dehydrorhamnose reductase [Thermoleophilaceae bacterium]